MLRNNISRISSHNMTTTTTTTNATVPNTANMFNEKVRGILKGRASNTQCYIEFIELCAFYQKMNEHNIATLKQLSSAICEGCADESINSAINNLTWDWEDAGIYRFMISFTNL